MKKAIRARGKQPDPNAESDKAEVAKPKARGRPKKKQDSKNTVPEQSIAASSNTDTGNNKADDSSSKDDKQQKQECPLTPSKEPADKGEALTEDPSKRKADTENNPTPNKGEPRKRRSRKEAVKETTGKEASKEANEAIKTAWQVQDCLGHTKNIWFDFN